MSNKRSAVDLLLDSSQQLDDDFAYQSTYSKVWRGGHLRQEAKAPGPGSRPVEEESSFGEWKSRPHEPLLLRTGGSLDFDRKREAAQTQPKPKSRLGRPAQLSDRIGPSSSMHQQVLARSGSRKEAPKFIVRTSADSSGLKAERSRRSQAQEEPAPKKSIRFVKKPTEQYQDLEDFIKKTIGVEVLRRKKKAQLLKRRLEERKGSQESLSSNQEKPRLLRIPSRYFGKHPAPESAENTVDQTAELYSLSFVNRPVSSAHKPALVQPRQEPLGMRLSKHIGHSRQASQPDFSPPKRQPTPEPVRPACPTSSSSQQRVPSHKRTDSLPGRKEPRRVAVASQPSSPKKPQGTAVAGFDASAEISGLIKKIDLIYIKMLYQQSTIAKHEDARQFPGKQPLHARHPSHGNSRTYLKNAFVGSH